MHKKILKEYFGYDVFKDGQEFLIENILKGNDVVGVMPTGAGKSICFQIPAMVLSGITLVVSPLISLMKDQVLSLKQVGINAAFINSSLTMSQYNLALSNAKKGEYKIIYIAPERLENKEFLEFANNIEISMLAIDEAHCISQWGQDFRPSYLKIIDFINSLKKKPIISAFTATATKQVRDDIVAVLNLQEPQILVTGFDRKNLYFEVKKPKDKFLELSKFLDTQANNSGIIYCSTRKSVENVCELLCHKGISATRYHAGLSDNERRENQEDFIFDKTQIIVATNAFGMGIDKSNVSFVVHYNMPKNMESYYQEAGRAGRDGQNAKCILYYGGQDVRTNLYFIENNKDVEYADEQTEAVIKERDRLRLKQMTFYCHTSDCLREYILRYFGEKPQNYCGNCGNCLGNFITKDITVDAQKILSCVKRTNERYGIITVIDVLRGSKNEKILRLNLDKQTTYGIMADTKVKTIRGIINYLVLNKYLRITDNEYPVLNLGEKAENVLFKNEKLTLKINEAIEDKKSKEIIVGDYNKELYKQLVDTRKKLAQIQGVPAFVVFSDATLKDMCYKLPANEEEFLDVSGVGQAKYNRYGKKFLEILNNFEDDSNL